MYSGKRLTKEDTWRPSDLSKYLKEGHSDERRRRGGESTERHRKETEKESRKERDKQRESTRERRDEDDRHAERRKEGSRDRRGDSERRDERDKKERDKFEGGERHSYDSRERRDRRSDREKRDERDRKERDKYSYDSKERRDRKQDAVEKYEKANEKGRHRDNEKERDAKKEDKDKERRRHHRTESERRKHDESREGDLKAHERDRREKHRDRVQHTDEYKERKNDRERQARHSEGKEEKGHREEHRRHRDEKERRHKERDHHDEKRRRDRDVASDGREGTGDDVRRHRRNKERSERDQHRERRHREREEDEGEGGHHQRNRSSSETAGPERSRRDAAKDEAAAKTRDHQTSSVKDVGDTEQPVDDDEQIEQEYEDDFEEYEEDFEEMGENENEGEDEKKPQRLDMGGEEVEEEAGTEWKKEIEAIQRAMDEENKRVESGQSRQMCKDEEDERKYSRASEKTQAQAPHHGRFIDFMAAKQREVSQKVTAKQQKRSTELLRLIDLDFSATFSILNLPPVSEYDMYIRSFGTANTRQVYVQCNEDNVDRDIQTEEIDISQKWTQHPPEHSGACGDPNLPWEAPNKALSEIDFDSQRLVSFLRSASQVMVVLLEEDQAERESLRKHGSPAGTMSFSDGSSRFNTKIPFLSGRTISQIHVQRNTLMTVHIPTATHSDMLLDGCSLVCIWNIWEPSRPQKVLIYESEVKCCCFSPGKATLVFAGTSVGSVVLWDLREYASDHYHLTIEEEEWTFRRPTFSTDAVMASSGHFSAVTSIEAVPSAAAGELRSEVPLLASREESSGLSFQLASLDETGVLNFWVVLELPKANEAGSPTDLGLRPGGKVKLLHSSSILTAERSRRDAATTALFQTLSLKFLPTDSNHFFTGTNTGLVNHGTSHGLKATPKFYRCQEAGARPVDVTEIHFSPFEQHLFLVGCGDGSVRLHAVRHEHPVAEWRSSGDPVVSVQWSHTRPAVFCALDAASNLHIWDLLKSTTQPVITEKIHSDRVTAMAAFGDSGQQNSYSGVVLAHQSGTIQVQYFTTGFTTATAAEVEKLESMMNEAF